uniref:Uncharacterized protein n=1 Tax=Rhizophora mucronata TaxID=61149 RepID=A0A2P2Q4L1_RHIMU
MLLFVIDGNVLWSHAMHNEVHMFLKDAYLDHNNCCKVLLLCICFLRISWRKLHFNMNFIINHLSFKSIWSSCLSLMAIKVK